MATVKKYHQSKDGLLRECTAHERPCQLGIPDDRHEFLTKKEAQDRNEAILSNQNGLFSKHYKTVSGLPERKITIGLDLDQTTGDFVGGFRGFLAQKENLNSEEAYRKYPAPKDYNFHKAGWFKSGQEFLNNFHEAEQSGIYRKMRAMPGAERILKQLVSDQNTEIVVITAREERWNKDTISWLKKREIPFSRLVNSTDKHEISNIDVYIDDSESNYRTLTGHGKTTILYSASYNQDVPAPLRARSWKDVPSLLNIQKMTEK